MLLVAVEKAGDHNPSAGLNMRRASPAKAVPGIVISSRLPAPFRSLRQVEVAANRVHLSLPTNRSTSLSFSIAQLPIRKSKSASPSPARAFMLLLLHADGGIVADRR
jgi:hypothetical protein